MFSIAIEIEHKKYAQLIRSDGPSTGRLDLTTLVDYQKRAIVRIFLFRSDGPKVLIREIVLDKLPKKHAGDIRIILTGELKGGKRLALTLSHGGQTIHSSVVPLRSHLRSKAAWLIIPAAAVVAGVILFIALYPRGTIAESGSFAEVKADSGDEPSAAAEAEASGPGQLDSEEAPSAAAEAEASGPGQLDSGDEPSAAAEAEASGPGQLDSEEAPPPQPAAEPVSETVTVYFEPNRSRIIDEARETLDALATLLGEFEEISVRIEGHCALRGSEQGRIELSDERSEAVRRYLLDRGWDPEGTVAVEGYGGNRPVTVSENDQYLNRRVEVKVTYLP